MKKLKILLILCILFSITAVISQEYEIYVSSGTGGNSTIKKYNISGEFQGDFVSPGAGGLDWPQDIIFLEDQNIMLVSGLNSNAIHKYNATTGANEGIWATVSGGPTRMKIGSDNLLYVLQWDTNSKVLRFELDGTPLGEWTNTGVTQSIGLDWDSVGNLYVSSFGLGTVRKYDSSGGDQGTFISALQGPTNIWFDPNGSGDMLINQWSGNKVRRYDATGAYVNDFIASITRPEGIAYLPSGNLLIGSAGTADSIREFESDGTPVGVFTSGNGLSNPNAIYVRDITVMSVNENDLTEIFVTPTNGNMFLLNPSMVSEYESLEVHNISGKLVDTIILRNNNQWDASKYAEGLYFISSLKGGQRAIQKIIIKN